jgi:error-prone DNA polymerase
MPADLTPPKIRPPVPEVTDLPARSALLPAYVELHCRSNFSFLVGASHPAELVQRALELGYDGLAITDECSVAGVVRAHTEMKSWPTHVREQFRFIVGSEFDVQAAGDTPGCRLVLLARTREGYGNLCELITLARLRCEKGSYRVDVRDLDAPETPFAHLRGLPDCWALLIPRRGDPREMLLAQVRWLQRTFGARARIAIELLMRADDSVLIERLAAVSKATGLPLVAAGDVLMHRRSRKALQDTLTAVRLKTPVADCGFALMPNAEQHLRWRVKLAQLYRPAWLQATLEVAQGCSFTLDELGYQYPDEIVPPGETAASHLRKLTAAGARTRYPDGVPETVQRQIEKELALIELKRYEAFFLTVHDIVQFAERKRILCQGRGSAANSAVCYCLGITAVNPTKTTLLFERFISPERDEAPDIDVDFEHERREEVIQYIYRKYGRHRTALAAAVASYRARGAVRDVGKALGFDEPVIDAVAKSFHWFDNLARMTERFAEIGVDATASTTRLWMELVATVQGFPRHLSQHTGGFVIARDKLSRMVPIETAAMEDRRVIQWDKDDLESLGLLKVDVLGLGMLTVLRRSLHFVNRWRGCDWALRDIPQDNEPTYAMIRAADTVGVFQIESRAQMSMLPRLKPQEFYDLVVEVAIVRPGPIQGGAVHPYLKRRQGLESSESPKPELDAALKRTLGVPIFQEQVMQICMIAAGFTPGEADELRRAMAAWKRKGGVHKFEQRIYAGMAARGYDTAFAEAIFKQILGFGEYGFPESHAYSFALLAYASAWVKCHEPAIFLAALLNSQPMGFYGPSQLVQDATRHGVEVRPADVTVSDWDCTLERRNALPLPLAGEGRGEGQPAVRLGLRMVQSLPEASAQRVMAARRAQPFADVEDLARRAALPTHELQALARADALLALAGHRRQQTWVAAGQQLPPALLQAAPVGEAALALPEAPEGEQILLDYASLGLTLRRHPLALLRPRLARRGWRSAGELKALPNGRSAWACGIVTMRQQPETANGTIFVTLEDETGAVNVIVWRHVREAQRRPLLRSRLLAVAGQWQTKDGVSHLVARRLVDVTPWLGRLATASRDFR